MFTRHEFESALDEHRLVFLQKDGSFVLVERASPTITWRDGSFEASVLIGGTHPGTVTERSLSSTRFTVLDASPFSQHPVTSLLVFA